MKAQSIFVYELGGEVTIAIDNTRFYLEPPDFDRLCNEIKLLKQRRAETAEIAAAARAYAEGVKP